jgi:hypothetical protein
VFSPSIPRIEEIVVVLEELPFLNVSTVDSSLLRIQARSSSAAESVRVESIVPEEGWELENKLDCSVIVKGLACSDSVELRITGIGGSNVLDPEVPALLIVECNTRCKRKCLKSSFP